MKNFTQKSNYLLVLFLLINGILYAQVGEGECEDDINMLQMMGWGSCQELLSDGYPIGADPYIDEACACTFFGPCSGDNPDLLDNVVPSYVTCEMLLADGYPIGANTAIDIACCYTFRCSGNISSVGCTYEQYLEFDDCANEDDGSCETLIVEGCTDETAFNFNSEANTSDGSCASVIRGCTDETASNFNPNANTNNGTCVPYLNLPLGWSMFGFTCLESTDVVNAFSEISTFIEIVKDEWGLSYLPSWEFSAIDNLEFGEGYQIKMLEEVTNFQFCDMYEGWCESDIDDDGICDLDEVWGCMDASSCNYVLEAEFNDGSCESESCADECGVPNGDNSTCLDECGVPNGDNSTCLDECGVPNGDDSSCTDECGVINGDNSTCLDECGVPNGDNSSCADECGVPNGDNSTCLDECGVPNGDNSTCTDECGVLYGNNSSCIDECGVPNGDNSSCTDECGVVNGDNSSCADECGIPNGDNSSCTDACGVVNGDNSSCADECGVPNGDNSSCLDCAGVVNGTLEDVGCGCGNPAAQVGYHCDGNLIQIGDQHAGGMVFQINEDGSGLVAGPQFANGPTLINGGSVTWSGAMSAAASSSSGGYNDWYLPNLNELELMCSTIGTGAGADNIGGFILGNNGYYWTRDQVSGNRAWAVRFWEPVNANPCSTSNRAQFNMINARIIRAF